MGAVSRALDPGTPEVDRQVVRSERQLGDPVDPVAGERDTLAIVTLQERAEGIGDVGRRRWRHR